MEFLGPLFAMGMFGGKMRKDSESGESMDEEEMKSFQEFTENNIVMEGRKYVCKICSKKFGSKDAIVSHIGNKHDEEFQNEDSS